MDLAKLGEEEFREHKRKVEEENEKRESKRRKGEWRDEMRTHPCVDVDYHDTETWIAENLRHRGVAFLEERCWKDLPDDAKKGLRALPFNLNVEVTSVYVNGEFLHPKLTDVYTSLEDTDYVEYLFPFYDDLLYKPDESTVEFEIPRGNDYAYGYLYIPMVAVRPEYEEKDFAKKVAVVVVHSHTWHTTHVTPVETKKQDGRKYYCVAGSGPLTWAKLTEEYNFFLKSK